ncbi:MAG: hypothetical protein J5950_10195, partial [Clostridia bacterium]|nr:hypothetical protein [Clostridia bacterium]
MDSNDDFLLFAWEKQCSYDPDATDGVIYKYRSSTQQFFYSLTHTFEAGSGKPVIGMYKLTTLDRLLGDYRANPGKWNEESWKRMCDDFRQHPEKAPGSFIRLKELHFEREKLKGRTLNDGRSIIQFIAADCASSISFDSPEKLKLKAEDFYYYREGENSGYVFISLKHVDSGRNFVTWEWCGEPRSDGHPERADRFYETDTDELEFMIRIGSHTKDVRHPLMLKKGIIDPTQVKLTNTCPICRKIKFSDDLMCNKCWREADSQVVKFEKELEQIKSK